MKQKTRLITILICLLLTIAIVEATLAFYSNGGGSIENVMTTKGSSVYMQELFDPADSWLPGESKQKELKFANIGERDQVIRFRIETQWFSQSGGEWIPDAKAPVSIKWSASINEDWTTFVNDDDWHYYNKILPQGSKTAKVMEAVTFGVGLSNDSEVEDFTNATYRIIVYMEALDVSSVITKEKWGKTFIQGEGLDWIE